GLGPADPIEVARGEELLREAATVLDHQLANREWICKSGLSLADFAIAATLADQYHAQFPTTELPNLQRWFKQVQALDIWKSTESGAE
ncbi:MAG TPA: glutathione binding-like protein, partial [Thiolinea sp.]|nr:glutathione binding-like protein [Thiolinea sp.]